VLTGIVPGMLVRKADFLLRLNLQGDSPMSSVRNSQRGCGTPYPLTQLLEFLG
jgi:hypothetical protein